MTRVGRAAPGRAALYDGCFRYDFDGGLMHLIDLARRLPSGGRDRQPAA
jgi:hypothetical protein